MTNPPPPSAASPTVTIPESRAARYARRIALAAGLFCAASTLWAQHVYVPTARSVSAIDTVYPFDIPLLAAGPAGDTTRTTTAEVLGAHLGRRPVAVFFWMTTCGPCKLELAEIAAQLQDWRAEADFAFVPVSIDFPRRRGAFVARAAEYPWTSYLDVDRETPRVMPGGLNGVPQVFVFDADGRQVFYRRKYREGDVEALGRALGVRG